MITRTIKPCPFCGNDDITFRDNKMWTGKRYILQTTRLVHTCTIPGSNFRALVEIPAKTHGVAIEIWNSRYYE